MKNMQRVKWIDAAKGIAIIFVVIGHVFYFYIPGHGYDNSIVFIFSHKIAYSFHMPLFMMLSGVVYAHSIAISKADSGSRSIRKKLISYGVPYICFSILAWLSNNKLSVSDLLLMPIYPIGFMWFIYALLIMTLIQVKVGCGRTVLFKTTHLVVALFMLILCPFIDGVFESVRFHDLIISDIMRWYFYYLLGVYGYNTIMRLTRLQTKILFCLILICSILFISCFLLNCNLTLSKILTAISGSIVVIGICMIFRNSIMEYVGKRSLPVYVLHNISISISQKILFLLSQYILLSDIVEWTACVIVGTILPIFVFELATRVKYLDFCFSPLKYVK